MPAPMSSPRRCLTLIMTTSSLFTVMIGLTWWQAVQSLELVDVRADGRHPEHRNPGS